MIYIYLSFLLSILSYFLFLTSFYLGGAVPALWENRLCWLSIVDDIM